MTACVAGPAVLSIAVSLLVVCSGALFFSIGRGLGMVEESQAEEKQNEVLNEVLGFAEGLEEPDDTTP